MTILALDTSLKNITLVLIRDQHILVSHNSVPESAQSTVITRAVHDIFQQAGISVDQMNTVLFCNGPGSFTSLRVGLATVQGLFLKSNVRLLTTSSLLFRCLSESDRSVGSDGSVLSFARAPLGRDRMAVGCFGESFKKTVPAHIQSVFKQRIPSCADYFEGFLSGENLSEMNKLFPALSNIVPDDVGCTDPAVFLTILEKKWFEEMPLAEARLFYMIEPDVGTPR